MSTQLTHMKWNKIHVNWKKMSTKILLRTYNQHHETKQSWMYRPKNANYPEHKLVNCYFKMKIIATKTHRL